MRRCCRAERPYDVLVQVMDALRAGRQVQAPRWSSGAVPDISIGDAPIRQAAAR